MSASLLFWILMILWFVLGAVPYARGGDRNWSGLGSALLVWACVALLGWKVFGSIIQG